MTGLPPWAGFAGVCVLLPVILVWTVCGLCRSAHPAPISLAHVGTSRFRWLPTWVLCTMRGVICGFIFTLEVLDLSNPKPYGPDSSIYYFTVWNWTVLGIYFAFVATASMVWCFSPEDPVWCETGSIARKRTGRFVRICQVLCSLNAANILMVDVMLWAVLYPTSSNPHSLLSFMSLNHHAVNFVFMMLDLFLNAIPPCPTDLPYVILFAIAYCIFNLTRLLVVPTTRSCIVETCPNYVDDYMTWPYFFLDTSKGLLAIGYYIGLAVVNAIFFVLATLFRKGLIKCCGTINQASLPLSAARDASRAGTEESGD